MYIYILATERKFCFQALQYVNSLRSERSGKAVKTTVLDQVAGGTVSIRSPSPQPKHQINKTELII